MVQKVLGVWFFASIIVLSYIATIHIVTSQVTARSERSERPEVAFREPMREAPEPVLSGPVYLAKRSPASGMQLKYRKPVKKSSVKNWNHIGQKKSKKLTNKHGGKKKRQLSSHK